MRHKIYPTARRRIVEIWHYTDKTWGEEQADSYVRGLYKFIEKVAGNKHLWRRIDYNDVQGLFFVRYKHHYIFFRELSTGVLGIINVLHESMDIPSRLLEDLHESPRS
jgi:plasmid stabilization system protein ParE